MLTNLYIQNIVLIDKINIAFFGGLNILTGETGAGKSILLDALALALGARSDINLIRAGCDTATVIAEFDKIQTALVPILQENSISDYEQGITIRRVLSKDGKGKAWINDTPISIKTLKTIGDSLIEIHGQFANYNLLNPSTHIQTLDNYGIKNFPNYCTTLKNTADAFNKYHHTQRQISVLQHDLIQKNTESDFLTHSLQELQLLNPQEHEESELYEKRCQVIQDKKNNTILSEVINILTPQDNPLEQYIFDAIKTIERIKTEDYTDQIDKLYNAAQIITEVRDSIIPKNIPNTEELDSIEERLFNIRTIARKHRVNPDELPNLLVEFSNKLETLTNSQDILQKLQHQEQEESVQFYNYAKQLSALRQQAAQMLRQQILLELPDLKLDKTDFMVNICDALPTTTGLDDVTFMIKTNPGMPFAPLHKSASGGELARLMLALRVVLSEHDNTHTFVFDEIDTGISGATASAIGSKLKRLAFNSQALVITHSAQVSGFADKHFKITKQSKENSTITSITELSYTDHINEIARIISGDKITEEAVSMAKTLLN